jgi:RNA polymerase sigma factor (sigma-70 family)
MTRASPTRRSTRFVSESQRKAVMAKLAQRNQRVLANQGLVHRVARRYRKPGVDYEAVVQEGNLGLIQAAEKFQPRKGYKFSTYATPWIRSYVQRAVGQGYQVRVPEKRLKGTPKIETAALSDAFQIASEGGIGQAHARASLAQLRKRINRLPKRQREVLTARYFTNGRARSEPWPSKRVATALKLTPGRVSQIEKAARTRLARGQSF